jgi:hypothetical protein
LHEGTNLLVYGVQNRLEKLINDSNDSYQNNINDFQLRLDKSNELNQNKINQLEKQLNDSTNNLNILEIKLTKDFQLKLDELNQNKVNESDKKQTGK